MAYKINFKDSNCQYVEDYNAGKYGTKVKIYFCEGDGCCPKQYSGSVGTEMITADTIDELKLKLDRAVANRDKEIAKTLTDSKKKVKDADYTKQELLDAVMEAYGFNKKEANEWIKKASEGAKKAIVEGFKGNAKKSFYNDSKKVKAKDKEEYSYYQVVYAYDNEELSEEFNSRKEAIKYYNNLVGDKKLKYAELKKVEGTENNDLNDERITILKSFNNDSVKDGKGCVNCKDDYDDLEDEWDYEINCEGNQWADGGFDSAEEAEDNALAKVNELLEDFPDDYAVDDFDIVISNKSTGEEYTYDPYRVEDCNMATLTPGQVKLKRASKEFNQKDAKFCDASAEDIIDLFEEAYIKGRTWDWLKNKLPSTFLNLKNKKWEEIFPIQADRTGNLKGVHLTKPKNLSERYAEEIDELLEAFEDYMRHVEHLEDYGVRVDTYNYEPLAREIQDMIDNTDSKKQSLELEQAFKSLKEVFRKVREVSWKLPNLNLGIYGDEYQTLADLLNKGSYDEFKKYIANQINEGYKNKDYKEEQRKPIIYNNKGTFIRSDSKVGPLSEEAKAYIRKVMGGATTEDIDAKRQQRRGKSPWMVNHSRLTHINEYADEIYELKNLLSDLKREQKKEKRMDIDVSNRRHGFYKYTGKGDLDYNGRWKRNGGYEYDPGTQPTTVRIDVQGLNDLQYALAKILNSGTVDEVERNLQEALDITKKLPRNNPRVAEIKAKIKALLEKRANNTVKKRPLPDKKFVRDSLRKGLKDGLNSKELAEYIDLCKKLKLNTLADIEKFSKEHKNAKDQDLLEALRKEAKKLK